MMEGHGKEKISLNDHPCGLGTCCQGKKLLKRLLYTCVDCLLVFMAVILSNNWS